MGRGRGADAPHFAPPAVDFRASYIAALQEYHDEDRHHELDDVLLEIPEVFAGYVEALNAGVRRPGEPDFFLAGLRRSPAPVRPPDGWVPQTILWWVAGEEYVGRLSIRHRLTPHLLLEGGTIGYEVRPSARRRGHATAMLAAALPLAAALGVERARMDCDADNTASRRVIEKNGGVLDEECDGCLYFWVPTS